MGDLWSNLLELFASIPSADESADFDEIAGTAKRMAEEVLACLEHYRVEVLPRVAAVLLMENRQADPADAATDGSEQGFRATDSSI